MWKGPLCSSGSLRLAAAHSTARAPDVIIRERTTGQVIRVPPGPHVSKGCVSSPVILLEGESRKGRGGPAGS